ncbi:hypothetical protein HPP92_007651 [Vanilla planifolia]|uniref:Secreted protein n=1 Tax=Vanilla planifolia TaxID=51239 RepID=A0A835RRA8_VANPL|nr:hypothetical protein HPP92_007651 [Vanilla planifolia]
MGWWVAVEIVSVWLRWRWCCRAGFLSRCPVELEVERRHRHDLHVKREARRWMEIFAILISISLKRTCRLDRRGREAELFNLLVFVRRPSRPTLLITIVCPQSMRLFSEEGETGTSRGIKQRRRRQWQGNELVPGACWCSYRAVYMALADGHRIL